MRAPPACVNTGRAAVAPATAAVAVNEKAIAAAITVWRADGKAGAANTWVSSLSPGRCRLSGNRAFSVLGFGDPWLCVPVSRRGCPVLVAFGVVRGTTES